MIKFPEIQTGVADSTILVAEGYPFAKYNISYRYAGLQTGYLTEHALFFIIQGKKNFHFADKTVCISANELLLVKRGIYVISEQLPEDSSFEALVLFIPDKLINTILLNIDTKMPIQSKEILVVKKNRLLHDFQQNYLSFFRNKNELNPQLLPLKLQEIFLLLFSTVAKTDVVAILHSFRTTELTDIEFIVKANLHHPLKVADFAKICSRSETSFKRDFFKLFKTSPKRWINEQRLLYANQLIKNTRDQISDIAFKSGFESASHFIKLYKQYFGITPNKAKNQMNN